MRKYLLEVEKALSCIPVSESAYHPESYIGGGHSSLRYIGLRVPQLRAALKIGFSFSGRETSEVLKIWDYIWHNSDCYEVMSLALYWFDLRKKSPELSSQWPTLSRWSKRIDNWAHSDSLCDLYARILEADPKRIYPKLEQWNTSKNPWLRRISIVSLLYYSSQRRRVLPLNKILRLVTPQMKYDHYYVQKGVGWTLREAGNVYPAEVFSFLEKNIRNVSAGAYYAATEKLSKQQKVRLQAIRWG